MGLHGEIRSTLLILEIFNFRLGAQQRSVQGEIPELNGTCHKVSVASAVPGTWCMGEMSLGGVNFTKVLIGVYLTFSDNVTSLCS